MTDAPSPRSPARFFFETGFFACYAEATVKAGNRTPFELTDAIVDHAWDIAGDAHPDHNEFDRYLSRADSADARLAEAEATFRAHFAAEKEATGSPDELGACANSLRQFGAELFPTNRNGQAHFARVLMDSVANTIDAARASAPASGEREAAVKDAAASNNSIDEMAARFAKADGLAWGELCGFEQELDECDSATCVAANFEDHDPDWARGTYRKYARVALGVAPAFAAREEVIVR